jgi:hypothetical protein
MEGRGVTNFLLAVIAGCLLFGSGTMLSGIQAGGVILAVLAAIAVVGVVVFLIAKVFGGFAMEFLMKLFTDVEKATTPLTKSAAVLGHLCGVYIFACLSAIVFYASFESWDLKRGAHVMLFESGWGIGLAVVAIALAAWFGGRFLGMILKGIFTSPQAAFRIDMIGTFVASLFVLPMYLLFRAKPGDAYNSFLWGMFLWACMFFVTAVAMVFWVAFRMKLD